MDESEPEAYAVLHASRALLAQVARSMVVPLSELTLPQFRILIVLSSGGRMRMGEIAGQVGVQPSTLTRTVERLVDGGYVERVSDRASRREVLIALAPKGAAIVDQVSTTRLALFEEVLARLEPAERKAVTQGMSLFAKAAGEPEPRDLLTLGL